MSALDVGQLSILTVAELRVLTTGSVNIPRSHEFPKAKMTEWIVAHADAQLALALLSACADKVQHIADRQRAQK